VARWSCFPFTALRPEYLGYFHWFGELALLRLVKLEPGKEVRSNAMTTVETNYVPGSSGGITRHQLLFESNVLEVAQAPFSGAWGGKAK
jgi:hypothetical protein